MGVVTVRTYGTRSRLWFWFSTKTSFSVLTTISAARAESSKHARTGSFWNPSQVYCLSRNVIFGEASIRVTKTRQLIRANVILLGSFQLDDPFSRKNNPNTLLSMSLSISDTGQYGT